MDYEIKNSVEELYPPGSFERELAESARTMVRVPESFWDRVINKIYWFLKI